MPLLSPPYPAELPPALELFSKDPSLFRQIKGTFRIPEGDAGIWRAVGVLLGVLVPLGALGYIIFDTMCVPTSPGEQMMCGIGGLFSMLFGILLWQNMDQQWEFSGEEIRHIYGRRVCWCVPIETITKVAIYSYATNYQEEHFPQIVTTDNKRYSLVSNPELYWAIIEVAARARRGGMRRRRGRGSRR